ncbi:MAG TPA: hypothetical protein VLA77_03035 [Candidatus Saccharimonadales bacterium]|nr:hypothetical protein [Candidatus Saccharimonadales bacterium]
MNKLKLVLVAVASFIFVALVAYFFVLPAILVGEYKNTIGVTQPKVDSAVNAVVAYKSEDSFVSIEVDPNELHTDLDNAKLAIEAAEESLQQHESKLLSLKVLPFLDFNPEYKTAIQLKNAEISYVQTCWDVISEAKQTIGYATKTLPVIEKLNEADAKYESTSTATSVAQISIAFADSAKIYQDAAAEFELIQAPESVKKYHEQNVVEAKRVAVTVRDMLNAINSADYNELVSLEQTAYLAAENAGAKAEESATNYIKESVLKKLSDKIKEDQQAIGAHVGEL